jgi:acyl-CoA thioester hydrolase
VTAYKFSYPLQIRYGDLDPQWHVNNAHFVTFIEQARFAYLVEVGLFDGQSFLDLGLIVADVHVSYIAPITYLQKIRIGTRVSRIGTKSLTFEYLVEDEASMQKLASAETIMVAYDYRQHSSMPVPTAWREKITTFEHLETS